MKRRTFFKHSGIAAVSALGVSSLQSCIVTKNQNNSMSLKTGEIMHTVIFDLKYPVGSVESKKFINDAINILTKIPGVIDFNAFRQCSPKNDYQYGFFMKFKNQNDFDFYTNNPDHCKFVDERWNKEVVRFQESDFEKL